MNAAGRLQGMDTGGSCPECGMVVELEEAEPQARWLESVLGRVFRCGKCRMPVSMDEAVELTRTAEAAGAPYVGALVLVNRHGAD